MDSFVHPAAEVLSSGSVVTSVDEVRSLLLALTGAFPYLEVILLGNGRLPEAEV